MGHSIVKRIIAVTTLLFIPEGFAMRTMDILEKYDLSKLSYIGMNSCECGSRKTIFATILDPEGLPHTVREGSFIGKDYGLIERITPNYIRVREVHEGKAGEWFERAVTLTKVEDKGPRTRFGYEKDRALHLLGEIDAIGKQLREQLIQCRRLFGEDAKRLACFDEAVGSLFCF